MAPKRGTKRAAEAEVPAAKRLQDALRQHGVMKSSYNGILEAINHPLAKGLNEECRKMLVAMLPQGVCVPASERHALQDASVKMLDDVFQGILAEMQAEIDTETEKLSCVEASKASLEFKVQEASAALAEASAAFALRKATLAEAAKAVLTTKVSLADAEKEQRQGDASHNQAKKEKDSLESALAEDFRLLRDGEVEAEEAQHHYDKLAALTSTLGLEESLMTALPTSMVKKPSARGSFDTMVVAQLEEGLLRQVAKLNEVIEAGAPAAEARQAAVAAACNQLESAKQAQQLAADELNAATELQQQREKEHEASLASMANYAPEYKQATETRDSKVEQLQLFKDWNLACFETVRDRESALATKKQTESEAAGEGTLGAHGNFGC